MLKEVLYISRVYPEEVYERLNIKTSIAANKFNRLLIEGLANQGIIVHVIGTFDSSFETEEILTKGNIQFHCAPKMSIINKIKYVREISKKIYSNENSALIADYLNVVISLISLKVCKKYKRKNLAIVTDLPDYLVSSTGEEKNIKQAIYEKIAYYVLNSFDKFVLLTEQMTEKIRNNIDYMVMEGVVDETSLTTPSVRNKEIIYAGSLHKEYGIKMLVEAFVKLNREDFTLKIFGDGNYVDEIVNLSNKYKNIQYYGVVKNEEVVEIEKNGYLLVNPRSSKEEFTKYSFPSKNMEYMLSGTPVLTAKLPGMPEEYEKYVYIFEEETSHGLCESLQKILAINEKNHFEKGNQARDFVLINKNKNIQANKIVDFLLK